MHTDCNNENKLQLYFFFLRSKHYLPLPKRAFSMDYTINGVYTRNGNQYCPIAIMLHRDCRYTMQLSTTRWTCQERNEGDQWIFNCQYGTDSRQNFSALYNWPGLLFPAANYNQYLPLSSPTYTLMRFRILTINLHEQVASMSRITLLWWQIRLKSIAMQINEFHHKGKMQRSTIIFNRIIRDVI